MCLFYFTPGSKLQVSIQKQDDKGRYHVLLMADSGQARVKWTPIQSISCMTCMQPCQNVLATSNFATFSQLLADYSILDFTRSPLAGKGTWHLLPTTPSMLPTATKHFDRAVHT